MKSVLLCIGLCALLTPFNLLARGSSGASFDLQEEPACGNHNQVPCLSRDYSLPLKKVHPDDNPTFKDDLDFYGLQLAIDRQIIRYNNKNIK